MYLNKNEAHFYNKSNYFWLFYLFKFFGKPLCHTNSYERVLINYLPIYPYIKHKFNDDMVAYHKNSREICSYYSQYSTCKKGRGVIVDSINCIVQTIRTYSNYHIYSWTVLLSLISLIAIIEYMKKVIDG